MTDAVTVEGGDYALTVAPTRGGALLRLHWAHPDGRRLALLRGVSDTAGADPATPVNRLASFLMAPFSNRIDGARFDWDGERLSLPMNKPEQQVAIHGLSRDHAWRVAEAAPGRLALEQTIDAPETPWRYAARQDVAVGPEGVRLSVTLENRGPRALPFGFGLHPWFPRSATSRLTFEAATTFTPDARTLPISPEPLGPTTDFRAGARIVERLGLDRPYAGWIGHARIDEPEAGYVLEIGGDAGLPILHVYAPPAEPVFCVEPCTHLPNVLNRRAHAAFGDMTRLEPGRRMAASMTIAARAA